MCDIKNRVMVDIETLSTEPDAVVLSIGAVRFGAHGLRDEFSVVVDPVSCADAGLQLDVQTVLWWFEQPEEARLAWLAQGGVRLEYALMEFREWLLAGGPVAELWAKGANFDPVILKSAFAAAGVEVPWNYWAVRCFRTWREQFRGWDAGCRVDPLVKHDALLDARAQASWLLNIEARLAECGVVCDDDGDE